MVSRSIVEHVASFPLEWACVCVLLLPSKYKISNLLDFFISIHCLTIIAGVKSCNNFDILICAYK